MELQIIESQLPIIKSNYEELKAHIKAQLAKYENLIVTQETQADCKNTKKELSKLEKQIDRFRIDKAKELAVPITEFENQMKELKALVTSVTQPIDKQLKSFEEERKNKRRGEVKSLIDTVATDYQLDEKHAPQLTLDESYLNKTATDSKILTDLKNRAEVLKTAQDVIAKHKHIIQHTCNTEHVKLDSKPFIRQLELGRDIAEVVADIHETINQETERRLEAERKKIQHEQQQMKLQLEEHAVVGQPDLVHHVEPMKLSKEVRAEPIDTYLIEITANQSQRNMLKTAMQKFGIKFKVIEKVVRLEEVL